MFHKPFRVQSTTPCKSSEKRRLKKEIASFYPTLSPEQLEDLLPSYIPLFVVRLVTYGGVIVTTYHADGEPLFFEHGVRLVPSVYALWRYSHMLRTIMILPQALGKLQYGADLVLDGIVREHDGGLTMRSFVKGQYCALLVKGQLKRCGVGVCLMSTEEMELNNWRLLGGVRVLHLQSDLLWEMGSMSIPIDPQLKSCIKAAAQATSTRQYPDSVTNIPDIDPDMEVASHVLPYKTDEDNVTINPSETFEEFRRTAVAALTPGLHATPEEKRATIAKAVEERARYMRTIQGPKIGNLDKKVMNRGPGVFTGLSKNPEKHLFTEAERILDNFDDEMDEVGVTLPEEYQSDVSSMSEIRQYYTNLGMDLSRQDRALCWHEDRDDELDDEEQADFKDWLKSKSTSDQEETDEIGITLPKEYDPPPSSSSSSSKKKAPFPGQRGRTMELERKPHRKGDMKDKLRAELERRKLEEEGRARRREMEAEMERMRGRFREEMERRREERRNGEEPKKKGEESGRKQGEEPVEKKEEGASGRKKKGVKRKKGRALEVKGAGLEAAEVEEKKKHESSDDKEGKGSSLPPKHPSPADVAKKGDDLQLEAGDLNLKGGDAQLLLMGSKYSDMDINNVKVLFRSDETPDSKTSTNGRAESSEDGKQAPPESAEKGEKNWGASLGEFLHKKLSCRDDDDERSASAAAVSKEGVAQIQEASMTGSQRGGVAGSIDDDDIGEMDEIGISVPEKYQSRDPASEEEGSESEGSEEEEEEEEEEDEEEETEEAGAKPAKGGRTWYSIPEQKKPMQGDSAEDAVDMDELLRECFFEAMKRVGKSSVCPLLTSTFYRSHMVELCPADLKLDVKKSSHKKLSRFLLTMQQHGIIKLGENDKGSEIITEFDFKHPLVKCFTPTILPKYESKAAVDPTPEIKQLKIETLYMPSHRLVSFFRQLGFTKASLLDYQQVRESVLKYIKENKLVDTTDPKHILPDLTLGDALQHRGATVNKGMLRQDLLGMIFDEMKPAYSIKYGKGPPVIRRGKLFPVKLSLVQKMGNKKVTLVDNLECYGIPATDLAQSLQKLAAASTTLNDVPGKPTARQVQVQGNAVKVIAKLLQESYGLPLKHIEAIDKIKPPKTQKKRKRK